MDGTQAVESVVCCEQGPGPLQAIWTGHWKYGADAVWLPTDFVVVVVTIMDMWIPHRGGRCSLFLMMRCFQILNDVIFREKKLDVF